MRVVRRALGALSIAASRLLAAPGKTLATALAMGLSLVAAIGFVLAARAADRKATTLVAPDVVAYLEVGLGAGAVSSVRDAIARIARPERIDHVSAKEALARLESALDRPMLDDGGIALVPASLEITLASDAALSPGQIATRLEGIAGIDDVEVIGGWSRAARETLAQAKVAANTCAGIAALMFFVVTFSAIGRRARAGRAEAETWSLLGAKEAFVRAPFVVEGAMCGVIAAVIAAVGVDVGLAVWPAAASLAHDANIGLWIAVPVSGAIIAMLATPRRVTGWLAR